MERQHGQSMTISGGLHHQSQSCVQKMHIIHMYVFRVEDEEQGYRLHISGFSGTAGDSLEDHNQKKFTTKDVDNDDNRGVNCAVSHNKGGWWFTG